MKRQREIGLDPLSQALGLPPDSQRYSGKPEEGAKRGVDARPIIRPISDARLLVALVERVLTLAEDANTPPVLKARLGEIARDATRLKIFGLPDPLFGPGCQRLPFSPDDISTVEINVQRLQCHSPGDGGLPVTYRLTDGRRVSRIIPDSHLPIWRHWLAHRGDKGAS